MKRKSPSNKACALGLLFIGLMVAAFVISNPYLLFKTRRIDYFETMLRETSELSQGYGVVYEKGIAAAWPVMRSYFGEWFFLCLALAATLWGICQKRTRFFSALTLAWLIPLTFSVLFVTHFKYQYWLPVAVPFISNIILFFPAKKGDFLKHKSGLLLQYGAIGLILLQLVLFVQQDTSVYLARVNRQENNPRVSFYKQTQAILNPFDLKNTNIFYDYRLYVPSTPGWSMSTNHGIVTYDVVNPGNLIFCFYWKAACGITLKPARKGLILTELSKGKIFYQDAMLGKIIRVHPALFQRNRPTVRFGIHLPENFRHGKMRGVECHKVGGHKPCFCKLGSLPASIIARDCYHSVCYLNIINLITGGVCKNKIHSK